MFRRSIAVALAVLILKIPALAAPQTNGDIPTQLRQIRPGVRVEVKLRRGDKITGRIGPITSDSFEIERAYRAPARVPFADVESVREKQGLSTGTKVGIGVGIFAGMAVLVAVLVITAIGRNG